MIADEITIAGPKGPMQAYVARRDGRPRPAVIVLEGIYGFDAEMRRITNLVAQAGYTGIAIDYLRGGKPEDVFHFEDVCRDVAAARDWANHQPFVQRGKIAAWGFGWGGTAAFLSASLPGLSAAVAFYGQSIARPLPGAGKAAIDEVDDIRAPLLLVFGGHDEQIGEHDIETIRKNLTEGGKTFEIEVYPEVGHSFFREDLDTLAARQIADAWDRVNSFLQRAFK
jgi:carboxymethylenebutenolidase